MSTLTTAADTTSTHHRRAFVAAVAIVAVVVGAYLIGRSHPATIRHGQALSASGVITAEVDGADITIPRDVAWVDSSGAYHGGGRPECLPPVGIGTIAVTFATVRVKDPTGYERDQTIWVDCTGWDPAEDLTPRQRANLEPNTDLE